MIKHSKSLVMLLGSVSIFATMAVKPVKAHESLKDQFYATARKVAAAPKKMYDALPDVMGAVQTKATTFGKQKARIFVDKQAGQVAEFAKSKLHALMYRHADVHVVNDNGVHVGFIEDINPRVGRNLIKKALGIDLDTDLPGVPIFMAKVINNVIEKQAANYLESTFQKHLNTALTELTMKSLENGLGLAQMHITKQVASSNAVVEEENDIKAVLAKATPVNEILAAEDLSAMSELVMAIQANLKLKIHSWLNEVANETASTFINQFMEQTGETVLRGTEVTAGAAVTLVAGVVTGGTGSAAVAGLVAGDRYISEGGAGEESYLRQAIKWLTNFDPRKEELEKKITIATTNQINGNIDAVLKQVGAGALVLSAKDYELVNGKYKLVEDESGFWNMELVEEPYSVTTFANRIANNFKSRAAAALQQAQVVATQVKQTVQATAVQAKENATDLYSALGDMNMAMGPGLAYEEPEPTAEEILQKRASDAFEERNVEEIGKIFQELQEKRIAEENAAKKSWWKFW